MTGRNVSASGSIRRNNAVSTKKKSSAKGGMGNKVKSKKTNGGVDKHMLIPLLIISAFGLLMVSSACMYTSVVEGSGVIIFIKQAAFVVIGIGLMLAISKIDYRFFNNMFFAYVAVAVSVLLLVAVKFFGVDVNGARRWISLGFTTFQPSELAKAAGCLYMACTVVRYPEVCEKGGPMFLRCIIPMALLCGLTAIEPSMSAAIAIAIPMIVILFLAVKKFRLLLPYIGLAIVGIAALLIQAPWRLERIFVLFGSGTQDYQISQSLLAIGSGGVLGKGLGNGIQKYLFLPELENDFIFANIGEETGMIGCMLVLGLFTYLVFRGIKNMLHAPDAFGFYYAAGVIVLIGFQVVVNVGVAVSVLPVTGMALPFISSGGSSMVMMFIMMGPILNLTAQVKKKQAGLL